jgi:Anti-sigma-K factor rskA/Putative zinc-finger
MADHPSREDLVAFALGALDPGEERPVAEHASGCRSCTRELEALAPAVAVLGESVEQLTPPPEMRVRVLAIVNREAEGRGTAASEHPRPRRRGLGGLILRPAAALAAAAVVAAGVAGYLIAEDDGGGAPTTTVAVMPEVPRIGGTLEVDEDSATLELEGMSQLTGAEVYQVWVARGSSVSPSSSFVPEGDGTASAEVPGRLEPGTKVMVTREPRAGRTSPTLPVLLSATVQ